jgi:DMSO/TMAO reductase YedYZ molybdopterin-dependent catalytic subunit
LLRGVWQIRTLPERVMEWLLLYVPLDLFEKGLAQLGADAKEVALIGAQIGMAVVLALIGVLSIRAGWRGASLLALGVVMWLITMTVVMPVTGAGLFATGLLIAPVLTNAGYLLVFLGYASVLTFGRLASTRPAARGQAQLMRERRAFLAGVVGTLAAGGLASFVGRDGGQVTSALPLAAAPTAEPPAPTVAPIAAAASTETFAPTLAASAPVSAPAATPTSEPYPNPPPPRRLPRDKDGSLTAAGRPRGELAPAITANADFYVVTKNAVEDPIVDAAMWRLVIDGEVNNPVQVDYRTLRALPVVEVTKTLECISNFTAACNLTSFGCDLLSTARFRGARLSDVLNLAGGLKVSAVGLACLSTDEFSAGLPVDVVHDPEALVVYDMNNQPLPREHGFPARLLVPGRYGMKDPKWLAGIRAMTQEYAGWYEQRNWNKDGIVKTMARIDVPADGATLVAGQQRVAGIAYAGDRGVSIVELSSDDGATWVAASFIEPMPGRDAMVRWESTFVVPPTGTVSLTVRATDGSGVVQTEEFQLPQPDGASGRDSITVSAA